MKLTIPSTLMGILLSFSPAFSDPTFENFLLLTIGSVLTIGPRTVTNILRSVRPIVSKHFGTYHRFLSRSQWRLLDLAKILCSLIFHLIPGTIELVVDETLSRHRGKEVFGKSAHRDPALSSHKRVAYSYGHKWVVLCVRFRLPSVSRPWALPILCLLWLKEAICKEEGIKHRKPIRLTIIMLRLLHKWFPDKTFILSGDGAYASLELMQFASKTSWCQLVSRLRMDAAVYGPPKKQPKSKKGRKPLKGKRLKSPEKQAKDSKVKWKKTTVTWYGGVQKEILYVYQIVRVFQSGRGVCDIASILVRDPEGLYRDEAFLTTDLAMPQEELVRHFVERWPVEVTFQESRKLLHIESTRNRKKESVLRSFPLLLGLFSLISLWYDQWLKSHRKAAPAQEAWYEKQEPTFQDALETIRTELWEESIFSMSSKTGNVVKIPKPFLNFVTSSLARAA